MSQDLESRKAKAIVAGLDMLCEAMEAVTPQEQPMSEAKHTPGPWRFKIGDSFSPTDYLIEQDGGDDKGFERGLVIMRWKASPYCETKVEQANARLMAAAPELLQAAKQALHDLPILDMHQDSQRCQVAMLKLQEAIAKTEGQEL